jgi:hypothetical protein
MCCTDLMACEAGPTQCQDLIDCLVDGTSPSECAEMHEHPSTNDLVGCIETNCTPPCT